MMPMPSRAIRRVASTDLPFLSTMVTENAHKNGIWVGICGELGADLALTETFLAIGVDELSVTPRSVQMCIRDR